MLKDSREIFSIQHDLQNGSLAHDSLAKLAYELQNTNSSRITIDLSNVNFIASNLFSVLGCILYEYAQHNPDSEALFVKGVTPAIKETMQKNGFCVHLGLSKIPDAHNTVIPYKSFPVNKIDEYERYLTLNLFTRRDLPIMTQELNDTIRDSLLELFKNVSDHTSSKQVFTCGQYFPKSRMLYFTIVDIGETVEYNVNTYHNSHNLTVPNNTLLWAMEEGNSTSFTQKPRGIGLSLIKDFVMLNKGEFYIFSHDDTYEFRHTKERFKKLNYPFPGTTVTIGFNLRDDAVYYLNSGTCESIQF